MKITVKKLSELHKPAHNIRRHSEKQLTEYIRSIEMFGQVKPLVVAEDGEIIAGNGLYEALLRMGRETCDCYVMVGLTDVQKKKLMMADNKVYELGFTDVDAIEELVKELDGDVDVPGWDAALYWETSADEYVPIGATYTDVQVTCQTVGTAGNDYAVGDIHTAVDIYDYYSGCSNITVSANGSDAPDDEEFYELMRDSQSAWSDAGPIGAYKYFAKRVSTEIADVVANSPSPGTVCLYAVMNDGSVAGEETKRAMVAACSPDEIRPLTDYVISGDPEEVPYDIDLTYYLTRDGSISASEAQSGVNEAVQRYIRWQSGKMGRDINPDRLRYLLLSAGIKRVDLKQPAFTPLEDGAPSLDRNDKVPQVAKLGTVTIKSGGYEDE